MSETPATEYPILCQTCLGPSPFIKMTRNPMGSECKTCQRPFTVFRWSTGGGGRFKKTEICLTCARLKNVCQTCVLDLEFNLPVQVRDKLLDTQNNVPIDDVNRRHYIATAERAIELAQDAPATSSAISTNASANSIATVSIAPNQYLDPMALSMLHSIARTDTQYRRNRAKICSFWVKGTCNRGDECPFRHELPEDPTGPLAKQNIKDRYFGTNDPVAQKILTRTQATKMAPPPKDPSNTTLFIAGITPAVAEDVLRDHFARFGSIVKFVLNRTQGFAFISFDTRAEAELAIGMTFKKLVLADTKLRVLWSKAYDQADRVAAAADASKPVQIPGLPAPLFASTQQPQQQQRATTAFASSYPSQNPNQLGSSSLPKPTVHTTINKGRL